MPFVTVSDGTKLFYELRGNPSNPILMFSNSLGTTLNMWDNQSSAFKDTFQLLIYDSRGHGKSDAPSGEYFIELLGTDVVELLGELSIDRVHFCGLSLGGMVGMWLGIHAPHFLNTLALCCTSAYLPPVNMWNSRIQKIRALGMESFVGGILKRWFTPGFLQNGSEDLEFVRKQFLETPREGYAASCAAIRDLDLRDQLPAIATPTLVIAAQEDQATPVEHGKLIVSHIANAEYVEVANAAHLSNIEQPEKFNAALFDFLERNAE